MKLKNILKYKYLILLIIIIFSIFRSNIKKESIYNFTDRNFEGIIFSYEYKSDYVTFIINGKEKIKCNYYYKNYKPILKYGDKVKLTGELKIPSNNTIPNTFNYKKYLNNNDIYYILEVNEINNITRTKNIIYKIKNNIQNRLDKYDKTGYLNAFILGNKNYIDDDVYNNYSTNGIIHIFSISGMHISLLSMILLFILNKIKKQDKNILIVIIFLLFYLVITNYQPSIIRSIIFFSLLNIFKLKKINIDTKDILLLSISLILLIKPKFIYNIGFQYSSCISYSLIYYSNRFNKNYIFNILLVSLVSFLISLPITINMNYRINLLSIFINIIFVPLVSFILYPLSLITFIIPITSPIFIKLINITEFLSNSISNINIFTIPIPKLNIISISIYYLLVYICLSKNNKYFIILALFILCLKNINKLDNDYNIYYLDVGQGDMTVIKYKDECIVIDTGPPSYNSKYHITDNHIKFLNSIGINDIDLLVITHGDSDHIGNANYLVNNFKVKNITINKGNINELEKILPKNKIVKRYKSKMKFYTLDHELCLNDDENCNSQVNYLIAYNEKILFMGDAPKEVELELLEKYNLKTSIIKLGHHGSKTSSDYDFLKRIAVKYGIISCKKNNRYNHPSPETIDTLNKLNIKYYNTSIVGTIYLNINKKNKTFKTYSP